MLKRILCVLSSFIILASSAYAWDSESFIGMDELDYYEFDWQPSWVVSLMALDGVDPPNSKYSVSEWSDWNTRLSFPSLYMGIGVTGTYTSPGYSVPSSGINVPDTIINGTWLRPDPLKSVSAQTNPSQNRWYYMSNTSLTTPEKASSATNSPYYDFVSLSSVSFASTASASGANSYQYIDVPFDVSDFGSFQLFSLNGSLDLYTTMKRGSNNWQNFSRTSSIVYLYVDGVLRQSFPSINGHVTFNNYTFDSTEPITDISFRFFCPSSSLPVLNGTNTYQYQFNIINWDVDFSVLMSNDFINISADQAQNDINDHNQIESQWTGSMSSNFNALNIGSFTWPSSLISAFALLSGIFNDIWNSMGDYRVVYVFPLLLGVILLLVGRLGKARFSQHTGGGED